MNPKRPLATALALLFLLLLLTSLAVRIWAANQMIGLSGPTHIAADGEQVMLFAAGRLFHLSSAGELRSEIPLSRTGLQDDPVDLRFVAGGKLLVAGQRPAAVRLCDPGTWECRSVATAAAGLIRRQLKVLPEPGRDGWLLTDARAAALWRVAPGAKPEMLLPTGVLAAPNDLAFARDGALWVADTDHRRIVELVKDDDGAFAPGREHAAAHAVLTGPAWYPMMLARGPDDRWWVTQAAEFGTALAELVIYDIDAGAQALVELPAGAYPTDVAAAGNAMLVTDMDRFAVYRVAGDGTRVEAFGDEAFRARLAEIRQQRWEREWVSRAALGAVLAFGALVILTAFLAVPADKRWSRVPEVFDWAGAPRQTPPVSGIHWLERDPAIERSAKWVQRALLVLLPLPVLGAVVVYLLIRAQAGPDAGAEVRAELNGIGIVLLLLALAIALTLPLIRSSMRTLQTRLGTDGRRLYIRRTDGREIAVEPQALAWTDRMILYRDYSLPLTGGRRRSLYAPGEVETWLGPLLRQARRLSALQGLEHQWKNGPPVQLWWLAGAAVFGTILAIVLIAR